MHLSTFTYNAAAGWSLSPFPALDSPQTLVIVFGAPAYRDEPSPLRELFDAYPASQWIGCSTAGEIADATVADASLSVAVVRFEHARVAVASAVVAGAADSRAAGEALVRQLDPQGLRAVFLLSDGLLVNGSELVKGANAGLPPGVLVTGGLAADGDRFRQTWVIRDGRPESGAITAAGFYGESLVIGHGSRGGWDSFGPERCITRSRGNVLHELDGKPALALYKEYLGERAAGLPATGLLFPLSIRADASDNRQLVRTILAVDEATQSMTFAGDVPEGHLARLMRANVDRLVIGASDAGGTAARPAEGPVLAVAVSCVGRRLVLGERTEEETEATLEQLPPGARQIGFYSYGELSPFATGTCDLHNQTMTLTTLAEAGAR